MHSPYDTPALHSCWDDYDRSTPDESMYDLDTLTPVDLRVSFKDTLKVEGANFYFRYARDNEY